MAAVAAVGAPTSDPPDCAPARAAVAVTNTATAIATMEIGLLGLLTADLNCALCAFFAEMRDPFYMDGSSGFFVFFVFPTKIEI
jgi:hypothetical protein